MDHETDFWTPGRFAQITQGQWLRPAEDAARSLTGVTIDSRTVQPGEVFVAIKGENHDGHDHVSQAIERGAGLVIVERETAADGRRPTAVVRVPDTVIALQQLASAWRDELARAGVKVIAVTGSNGKTTTRNLIHTALSARLRGTQSPKSFNNHLGVPLTLLATPREVDFVVAEVGTNHVGEIETLAKIVRPDAAVITTIGTAHIGHFGSREAIAKEKSALLKYLETGNKAGLGSLGPSRRLAVARGDEPYLSAWKHDVIPSGVSVTTFGLTDTCDVCLSGAIHTDAAGVHFDVASPRGPVAFTLPFLGEHNVTNALAAIAITRWCGVPDDECAAALKRTRGVEMRMQLVQVRGREDASGKRIDGDVNDAGPPQGRGITLINDAYNANPDSMSAALRTLASLPVAPDARRVAILADMFELGNDSASEHARMGKRINELNSPKTCIGLTILIGKLMQPAAKELQLAGAKDAAGGLVYFESWSDDLPARIAQLLRCDDLVLLKGSRGMRLERLVPAIEQRFASPPAEARP